MERWIKRSLREIQGPAARFRETARDEVPVGGTGPNYRQEQEIQMTFQRFPVHTSRYYTSLYVV
jgi:hypothetical protein